MLGEFYPSAEMQSVLSARAHTHTHTHTQLTVPCSWMSQKFCNILVMNGTIRILSMCLWRWATTLNYKMPNSFDILWILLTGVVSLTSSDYWESYSLSEISWTICLLYCDKIRFHLSHNKFFGLLHQQFWHVKHKLLHWLISLLFFYKSGFSIKSSSKVDMPLNKETKPKLLTCQRTNYHSTTNHIGYFARLELLWSSDIHTTN